MARLHHHLKNAFIPHAGNNYQPHALRRPMLNAYAAGIIAVKIAVVALVSFYAHQAHVTDITPAAIISLTNQARLQQKAKALKTNPLLTKAAESKAADMARGQYFAHVSPSGVTPWIWFKQAGYSYSYAGENLALDYISSEDVIAAWLNSPSHRRNLLGAKYQDIGVAVTTATINGADSLVVVQMFGAPVPPPVTKKITVPAQKPLPKTVIKQLAAAPKPAPPPVITPPVAVPTQVLGETTPVPPPVAPGVPSISTPSPNSLVRTDTPEFIGQAEPGSIVALYINNTQVASAPADPSGVFTIIPPQPLSQGDTMFYVTATARGLTSTISPAGTIQVDTAAPAIEAGQAVLLTSYLVDQAYDVSVKVSGQPTSVLVQSGGQSVPLTGSGRTFSGTIHLPNAGTPGPLTIQAADAAGNSVHDVLADPDLYTTGVVAATSGPWVKTLKLIFFSRAFLLTFLIVMFMVATLNVVSEWRHVHHPTIVASFLVVFLAGTLLLL